MTEHKTAVHIHGYHLGADGWDAIVWGTAEKPGTVRRGVPEAYAENASLIFWGTGSSVRDGVIESQAIYNTALAHAAELAAQCGCTEKELIDFLQSRSHIDTVTQNTVEEVHAFLNLCIEQGIDRMTVVASATHAPRSIRTTLSIIESDNRFARYRNALYYAPASSTFANATVNDVVIVEPPHRGDQPKWQTYRYVRELFTILKKGEETYTSFLSEFGELLKKYGVTVDWDVKK
jgi:hypothetical protein